MMPTRLLVSIALLSITVIPGPAIAQPARAPEVISLVTKDGVQLKLSYFPSTRRKGAPDAKQVTPVVLLHDYKGTRAVFNSLARQLQAPAEGNTKRPSFAAITVDLRAHGDSTRQILPGGRAIDLDPSKLRRDDYLAMAALDMEAVRSFLVGKNDEGELNLNKLCLVGSGMGANVAANWALQDWTAPPLAVGKQGQDVKAIVLISPRWSHSGLSFQAPMRFRPLKENVAWLLMYGAEDAKVRADVARIHKQLARFHPEPEDAARRAPNSLHMVELPSKLQADTLLRQSGAAVEEQIVNYLVALVANSQQPWISRRDRLP